MVDAVRWLGRKIREFVERRKARREARLREKMERFVEDACRPERIAEHRRWAEKRYGTLILDEGGFHHEKDGRTELSLQWGDVRTIRTFKRDLWAHDMVCLAFEIGKDEWAEVWEDMVDFDVIEKAMKAEFLGIPEDWLAVVVDPPFATNDRVLWRREEAERGGQE